MAKEKAKKIVALYDDATARQVDLGNYQDRMINLREQLLELFINRDFASYTKLFNNIQTEWSNISYINEKAEIKKKLILEEYKANSENDPGTYSHAKKVFSVECMVELVELLKNNLYQDIQHYWYSTKINYTKDLIDFLLEMNLSYKQESNEMLNLMHNKINDKIDKYLRFNKENYKYDTFCVLDIDINGPTVHYRGDETEQKNYLLQVYKAIYNNYNLISHSIENRTHSELNILHKAIALDNLNGYLKKNQDKVTKKNQDKATIDLKLPYAITTKHVNNIISTLALPSSSNDDKMILKHRFIERIKTSIKFRSQDLDKATANQDLITVIKKQADLIIKIITDLGSKIEYVNSVDNKNIENDHRQSKIAKTELQQLDETREVPKQILSLKIMAAVVAAVALSEGEINQQDLQDSPGEVVDIVSDFDYMINALTYEGIMADKSEDGHLDNQILNSLELLEPLNELLGEHHNTLS